MHNFRTSESAEDEGLVEYTVSVHNTFSGASPEDALLQFAPWIAENAYTTGYRVEWTDEQGVEHSTFLDADDVLG